MNLSEVALVASPLDVKMIDFSRVKYNFCGERSVGCTCFERRADNLPTEKLHFSMLFNVTVRISYFLFDDGSEQSAPSQIPGNLWKGRPTAVDIATQETAEQLLE